MIPEFPRQIFEKKKKRKYQISSKSVQLDPLYSTRTGGRTDGQTDKANSRFSQFRKPD
jgi:hypothetical protein